MENVRTSFVVQASLFRVNQNFVHTLIIRTRDVNKLRKHVERNDSLDRAC